MDFATIKEHNRLALLRVLAMLFAMIGLVRGGSVAVLPRRLRLSVLRLLRPAESSARRLILVEAQGMTVEATAPRGSRSAKAKTGAKRERKPSFPLIEALQRTAPPAPKHAPGPGPQIRFFDDRDSPIETPPPPPTPDDAMDAEALCRRLHALQAVLENLPKAARRLALWQARRSTVRTKSLRPGRPPGYRARVLHEIDEILRECHDLALRALVPPDTS